MNDVTVYKESINYAQVLQGIFNISTLKHICGNVFLQMFHIGATDDEKTTR